jgi:Tol biopolymer transport system component
MNSFLQRFKSLLGSELIKSVIVLTIFLFHGTGTSAQYFGRNKPGYKVFEFDVVQTPNFEIYHYLRNDSLIRSISRWSETWHDMHQAIFKDTLKTKNPIIFYSNHSDFQQTNTISSIIGTGTGGVTESLKNRVIMPVATSLAQTDHTLGHELVHAFQYNMLLKADTTKRLSINNIPLWMIEGMAEYLSIGSIDPHTAMWMRDALLNNDFPSLEQLTVDTKYFPYRYGQAFWAMAGKTWGDTIIMPLLEKTAQLGFDKAAENLLGFDEKTLSGMWKSATEIHFGEYLKNKVDSLAGRQIISEVNAGETNISPSISPDGKYIAFFSEKNLFTLDLFLADANTGKIIKKLSSVVRNNEIDDFSFIESSGTWSPDGKQFAFVIFSKGVNKLAFLDVRKSRIVKEYRIPGVQSFSNPSWSPDGQYIVFTGQVDGISDLYIFDLNTFEVDKLTSDFESNLHPSWSHDGNFIVYSQEVMNYELNRKIFSFDLALLDIKNKSIEKIDLFRGAKNLNPCFSSDDRNIFFLSDADGFRNLYKYDLVTNRLFRLTDYMTGISGITAFSPAISVSAEKNLITYNYYFNNKYHIWTAGENQFKSIEADKYSVNLDAGTLPPLKHLALNVVDTALHNRIKMADLPVDSMKIIPFRSKFKLDYISNNGNIGVSTGMFRNSMSGSVSAIFSDIVGNNQLYTGLALNGEIYDFGGQAAYINQKGKIKWGGAVSHVPYLSGGMSLVRDTILINDQELPVWNYMVDYLRMFEDNVSIFGSYPLSLTRRFEAQASSSWYYYRIDRYNYYYTLDEFPIGGEKEKLDAPGGSNFQQVSLAYVEDNSYYGITSPMQGHRARFEVEKYFGAANILTTLFDYRKYFYTRPITIAFRLYNYGMYGKEAENGVIPPFYIGYPWLIRGYENVSYSSYQQDNRFNVSWLTGTRIAVANAELRFPFTGPEKLTLIKSKFFLTDLNLFFDAGLAWSKGNSVNMDLYKTSADIEEDDRSPLLSTGASIRINLFGYLVIEPYYAFPLQNGGFKNGQFGLSFVQGW